MTKAKPFDASKYLTDDEIIRRYLDEVFETGDAQIQDARSTLERPTARTSGAYVVSGTDGTFLVSPGGFRRVEWCGSGAGNPRIQIAHSQ